MKLSSKSYLSCFFSPPLERMLTYFYRMIRESGLKIVAFDSLDDAAAEAVQLAI